MKYTVGQPKRDNTVKREKWYCIITETDDGDNYKGSKIVWGGSAQIAQRKAYRLVNKNDKRKNI